VAPNSTILLNKERTNEENFKSDLFKFVTFLSVSMITIPMSGKMKKIIRKVELHDESKLTANNDIEKKFVFTGFNQR
jgi:hypothetical protein